jgi:hypothetical protein
LLLPQPFPHLSAPHDGAAAHVGDAAAQVGAAAAQVGAAFTQLGAATPQEGAAQLGAAFAHPLPQPFPQAGLQHFLQLRMRSSKVSRQQDFPQPFPHLSVPQEGAAAQVGAAAAHVGAAAAQVGAAFTQEGAATPHEGATLAQLSQPLPQRTLAHLTLQHLVSQQLVSQPHPLEPSIRSSRSKPKLWVQAAMLSTNDPTKMFHFIERRLLITMEPSKLTHVPVRPDHANVFALPWGCGWSFAIGQVFKQSNCLKTIAGLLGRWGNA